MDLILNTTRKLAGALALGAVLICGGCQTANPRMMPSPSQGTVKLAPGDVVRLTFPGSPEYSQTQKIRADGKLSLALLGEVSASGKSLKEFQSELARLYKPQLLNTEVVVSLENSSSPVLISGAVGRPGRIALERPVTLFEAIMEAGGISPSGNPKRVHVVRIVNGEHRTQVVDLSPLLNGKSAEAFYVRGGDVIFVPQSLF